MIYNTRNRSNDKTESKKEKKTCFNAHFQHSQSEITGVINESQALFWCFVLIILRMASLDTLFLCFAKTKAFVRIKFFL